MRMFMYDNTSSLKSALSYYSSTVAFNDYYSELTAYTMLAYFY